ncbi:MAG: 50S ribosomal protein L11 methyltransferase [Alteraurantiacibacter sp.]
MSAVLEEHIDYLTLPERAGLYKEAIARSVVSGDIVADLGCGFGVLGIDCLKAGASRVYGIDSSDAIEVARETVRRAGLEDRYTCIRGSSFRTDLPEKVDVLICDHIGYFGYDYGILPMLADARSRFLKPGGKIIPSGLTLKIAAVHSRKARELVDRWVSAPVPGECAWLQEYAVNSKHPINLSKQDICSDVAPLGHIDLTSDEPDHFVFETTVSAEKNCTLDGLGGWFDCELAPGVTMTNSPVKAGSIGRDQLFLPITKPVPIKAGQQISITLRIDMEGDILTWTITPEGEKAQTMSTWKSKILTPQDLVARLDQPLETNQVGTARAAILRLVDGTRTGRQIEDLVVEQHHDLMPSERHLRDFIRRELGQSADLP